MRILLMIAVFLAGIVGAVQATEPGDGAGNEGTQTWSVWGGEVGVRWNRELAREVGLSIGGPVHKVGLSPFGEFVRFAVQPNDKLKFALENQSFRGFVDGSLRIDGGYQIRLADGSIDLAGFRLVPRADNPLVLNVVSADGKAWFYIDRMMYVMPGADDILRVRTMDVRISRELAARLGQPAIAGWAIANMELFTHVVRWDGSQRPAGGCNSSTGAGCNFAGTLAPDGSTYQADLFMLSFSPQYSRCQGCSGPGGSGQVVYTPSSTLKNNVNAGSLQTTIQGQGALGTSSALWAADIPWFEKFSGDFPPYNNDQHPYLIWNMYRIDADGRIIQLGRSGVKHAFLTVNSGSTCPYSAGHVLGRSCEDTYGVGNNDSNWSLGPRSEIIAATNKWGRCGSIYDSDCNGSSDSPGNGDYDQRLIVTESEIDSANHPGSNWMFESWYLARWDINIYNSMATVDTTQFWTGSVWAINSSNYTLGPAIDHWVDPANPGANASSSEVANKEGHVKVAVKVSDLGNGQWRYDYAVMNFDFARAVTQNSQPGNTDFLKVLSNKGFDRLVVPLPSGATVSDTWFADGDGDTGNDWATQLGSAAVTFLAPADNTLDWGSLYSFSVTVDVAPAEATVSLGIAEAGNPSDLSFPALAPGVVVPNDIIFADGFESPTAR